MSNGTTDAPERGIETDSLLDRPGWGLHFDAEGLVPVAVQDARTRDVLMLAFASREAVQRSLDTGDAWFWSRSRQELWHKGATSGDYLRVRRIRRNCEDSSLLYEVEPAGPACHTGRPGCFFRGLDGTELPPLSSLAEVSGLLSSIFEVIQDRQRTRPKGSYVAMLLDLGLDRIAKKVGEEAAEVIIAAKNRSRAQVAHELADLWFHTLVLLAEQGMTPDDVTEVLAERRGAPE
ncbi:MAG: bifunctional phosphoribosyl-AMP cyclohydrolase/phosphoribosyl-ATP pyrophosphatase [Dehalococcoidia bacterium]|nr:bifunctional phosphoribosyl-AMP cyclohydrolase/phosphoribosyl-ATP pyrophosphatase [Dehalococcoidia bacterium]